MLIIAQSPPNDKHWAGGRASARGALAWRMLSEFCLSVLPVEHVPGLEETPTDSVEN